MISVPPTVLTAIALTIVILVISGFGFKFAIDIYKYNKSSKGWLSILITMAVVPAWAAFRVYELLTYYSSISSLGVVNISVDFIAFPLLALIPLVVGVWYMKKSFEKFEITRSITAQRIAQINTSKRSKRRR